MVLVAVAGGTSPGLGRSIVRALHRHPDHHPVVLSRLSSTTPEWLLELGVETRKVDYDSQDSLTKALEGVHTIVSVLLATDGTWTACQTALLQAGLKAGAQRFVPSDFGCGALAFGRVSMLASQLEVWDACDDAQREHPGFEWASVQVGLFMNYLGHGAKNQEEALAGKHDDGEHFYFVGDMRAQIPLRPDGGVPRITMTEIGDIGRFVAEACSLPKWDKRLGIVGQTLGMDEVVKLIEQVRGRPMEVTYRSLSQIQEEKISEAGDRFWLELEEVYARDREDEGVIRPTLNHLFPDIKPMSINDYLTKYWSDS